MQKELTIKQKWFEIDSIINTINKRKLTNQKSYSTPYEKYVYKHFRKGYNIY